LVRPHIEDDTLDLESRRFLWERFGTCFRSFLSIFEITMAPGGFIAYRRLYETLSPLLSVFFVSYVCVVTFAVVRVITAMFLKTTLSASIKDDEKVDREKALQREAYTGNLKRAMESAEDERCGTMTRDEMHELLAVPRMQELLEDMELKASEVERLFQALDLGHDHISFRDFVTSLLRMKGPPRGADIVLQLHESRKVLERLEKLERNFMTSNSGLAHRIGLFSPVHALSGLPPGTASLPPETRVHAAEGQLPILMVSQQP
jgi:hypothetical protein